MVRRVLVRGAGNGIVQAKGTLVWMHKMLNSKPNTDNHTDKSAISKDTLTSTDEISTGSGENHS